MRIILPLLSTFLFVLPGAPYAQQMPQEKPVAYLTIHDTLLLTVADGKKFVHHSVRPKQTLFSLAKFYALGLEELYEYNPQFQDDPNLQIGARVKIPVPNRAIKRYKVKTFSPWRNAPIYYVVKEGDNLYQICKRYFDMPVDSIAKRNNLKNNNIRPGQRLLIGWMGTEGVKAEWRTASPSTAHDVLKERYNQEKSRHREKEGQGVCFWQRDSKEKGDLYALHREADIGTVMGVTNPMSGKTVYAKVIGRIPAGYERNVEVVLSPAAARQIGARDPRFFVRVKFLK